MSNLLSAQCSMKLPTASQPPPTLRLTLIVQCFARSNSRLLCAVVDRLPIFMENKRIFPSRSYVHDERCGIMYEHRMYSREFGSSHAINWRWMKTRWTWESNDVDEALPLSKKRENSYCGWGEKKRNGRENNGQSSNNVRKFILKAEKHKSIFSFFLSSFNSFSFLLFVLLVREFLGLFFFLLAAYFFLASFSSGCCSTWPVELLLLRYSNEALSSHSQQRGLRLRRSERRTTSTSDCLFFLLLLWAAAAQWEESEKRRRKMKKKKKRKYFMRWNSGTGNSHCVGEDKDKLETTKSSGVWLSFSGPKSEPPRCRWSSSS